MPKSTRAALDWRACTSSGPRRAFQPNCLRPQARSCFRSGHVRRDVFFATLSPPIGRNTIAQTRKPVMLPPPASPRTTAAGIGPCGLSEDPLVACLSLAAYNAFLHDLFFFLLAL